MKNDILSLLKDSGAFLEGHFLLTSGRHSNRYIEKFRLMESPNHLDRICKMMSEQFNQNDVDIVLGAAIGGIGVDKFKIEEAATNNNIPVYAIVIKQTLVEAISIMTKDIAESVDSVHDIINRIIDERTKPNDKVIIVGVGNTIGVIQ